MVCPLQSRLVRLAACLMSVGAGLGAKPQAPEYPTKVHWGQNRYVEYVVGNAPVVISMPHGGYLRPSTVKDRTWGVRTQDGRTQETGRELARKLREKFGLHPHLIISQLHRIKLDPNREIKEAAQGDKNAERAWNEFHGFIDTARKAVIAQHGKGLYIDLHGHGHPEAWIEFGYLLSSKELDLSDQKLNGSSTYANKSSLRNLARTNTQKFTEILRGKTSFGGLLEAKGYKTVPGPGNPGPNGGNYFTGGYNTRRWGSVGGGVVDGLQIELPSSLRRDLAGRNGLTTQLSGAIGSFLATHYNIDLAAGARITVTATMPRAMETGDPAVFTITRTTSTAQALLVGFLMAGTASPATDYQSISTARIIPAGKSSIEVLVRPIQDTLREGDETVTLILTGQNAGWPNQATAVILDDETDPFLEAHWTFDEASGTAARDISGRGRHGTLQPQNLGPKRIAGPVSGALSFDEVDDRVTVPNFHYTSRGAFTISFWFRAGPSKQSSTQYLYSHGSVLSPNSINVYRWEASDLLRTRVRFKNDLTNSIVLDVARNFMDAQWHFYALAVEFGGHGRVYIDGQLWAQNLLAGDSIQPTTNIFLGSRHDLSSTRFFGGGMDDVMIQSRCLGGDEVRGLMAASRGDALSYGSGCATSNLLRPLHSVSGPTALGQTSRFGVTQAAPGRLAAVYFGFSRSRLGSLGLPFDMAPWGAPGCVLQQSMDLSLGLALGNGSGFVPISIPADIALRGLRAYSQVMVVDPKSNPAGFVVSNGLELWVGG